MGNINRREFLKSSMAAGVALTLAAPYSRVLGANNDIRIAVVGVGSRGLGLCRSFSSLSGVRLVAICDADQSQINNTLSSLNAQGQNIKSYLDVRELLNDSSIDAVVSATPNHWHSLVTVWACQAGKDVYIEKPTSHEIWEGRKMVEAARKYNRIVQNGTQRRSSEGFRNALEYINQGNIGRILWVRGFCYKPRNSIGKVKGPQAIPPSVDYNLWCGPADMLPLMRQNLHYDWHWVWNTGNGDISNQGAHEVDESRWAIGDPKLPSHVISIGGRFGYIDDGETANTQIAFYDYQPAPIIFEVRGLPRKKNDSTMDDYRGIRIGVVVQCENGYFAANTSGGNGWISDNGGNIIQRFAVGAGNEHLQNFIDAVRSRKISDLNADIEVGHLSAALCHAGNISYRIGSKATVTEIENAIGDNTELTDSFNRMLAHLNANDVDVETEQITLGPMLNIDSEKEQFVGEFGDMANMLVKRNYREPFVVPDVI